MRYAAGVIAGLTTAAAIAVTGAAWIPPRATHPHPVAAGSLTPARGSVMEGFSGEEGIQTKQVTNLIGVFPARGGAAIGKRDDRAISGFRGATTRDGAAGAGVDAGKAEEPAYHAESASVSLPKALGKPKFEDVKGSGVAAGGLRSGNAVRRDVWVQAEKAAPLRSVEGGGTRADSWADGPVEEFGGASTEVQKGWKACNIRRIPAPTRFIEGVVIRTLPVVDSVAGGAP